ncbi:MAG TPA: hypothetical protein VEQ58_04695 [Polyangiaceae bacterium]|nr:hypothetical protein [Polyangiaceae bacterium]
MSAGGQSSGGVSSSGGAGGRSSGGASQSSGGGGAASSGGSAGTAGTAGGGATDAKPSAGCSKATGRPSSGAVDVAGDHYFTFPSDYDGTKPFPVLLGFHGCGGDNRGTDRNSTEYIKLTKGTAFETSYVRAVPVSSDSGGCWTYNTDISRVTKMYDDLTANYCVDTNHVFATGHSSGAQFIVQILTKKNDAAHFNFKAVAPTAASDYGALAGPTPVMYIQGKMDSVRGEDGSKTVARFVAANGCASTSKPLDVGSCQSGSTTVAPGCINYDSCTVPTVWCSHNDPAYSGTSHGVPCFAMKAMNDFFVGLH